MKKTVKLMCLVLAILAVLMTASCGKKEDPKTTDESDKTSDSSTTSEPQNNPEDNKKVKVVILAGQSNAVGVAYNDSFKRKIDEDIYAKYETGFDNVKAYYYSAVVDDSVEPNTNVEGKEFVKVNNTMGITTGTFGPELGFADKISAKYPNETVYIIKAAWGSASLANDLGSPSSGKTGACYEKLVKIIDDGLSVLTEKGLEPQITAMLWMQGETDATDAGMTEAYTENMKSFASDIRARYADYAYNGKIAIIDAGISTIWQNYVRMNEIKSSLAAADPDWFYISTIDAGLTTNLEPEGNVDIFHYDSVSQIKLGWLFAEQYINYMSK